MFATQRLTVVVAVALLSAACGGGGGGGGGAPAPSSAETTTPVITAPPTLTPEEQAEADIQATFDELIAAWDDFKANASDYGGTSGWNVELVGNWNVQGDASTEVVNWIAAWRESEIEQAGSTIVDDHAISALALNVTEGGSHEAMSIACLDMSELVYVTFDNAPADLPAEPPRYQTWQMSWRYSPVADNAAGVDVPGWYVHDLDLSLDESC